MKQIVVTAAIIKNNGKYLIAQRLPTCKNAPLKWEFPGGKIEFSERPRDCLKREIKEELGIDISVGEIFEVTTHVLGDTHIILLFFKCALVTGVPQKLGVNDFAWVEKNELTNFDYIDESDRRVVLKIINK
ncbi:MAG: (deoxy)nucleoside triphosphate pyrophosphohydrolase [Candidatus Aenigmarchaeota archaeon]|nr:(deoxy)nucleoside triphosphate pyrophosphohydrolase [Candidatus Aenigmarchaeota archaeon]